MHIRSEQSKRIQRGYGVIHDSMCLHVNLRTADFLMCYRVDLIEQPKRIVSRVDFKKKLERIK